mmetsp:Transcript_12990/g.32379  ORF Transcript_12990/g.32379 Transcript_12990/m.32379 type:complete len:211 (+) Transcript_12990:648-1280(+)
MLSNVSTVGTHFSCFAISAHVPCALRLFLSGASVVRSPCGHCSATAHGPAGTGLTVNVPCEPWSMKYVGNWHNPHVTLPDRTSRSLMLPHSPNDPLNPPRLLSGASTARFCNPHRSRRYGLYWIVSVCPTFVTPSSGAPTRMRLAKFSRDSSAVLSMRICACASLFATTVRLVNASLPSWRSLYILSKKKSRPTQRSRGNASSVSRLGLS